MVLQKLNFYCTGAVIKKLSLGHVRKTVVIWSITQSTNMKDIRNIFTEIVLNLKS